MSTNTLCWADIPVLDLDRAIAFYAAVLGQPVIKKSGHGADFALLPHDGKDASCCLVLGSEPSRTGPLIYLAVEDRLDAAIEAVRTHGGAILKDKEQIGPYGSRAIVLDSEGNRIAIHSHTT